DPGSVAFEAVKQGRERGADVIIVDTAGRLHTQDHLMAELTKVRRVIGKQLEGAPHETLLTIDATTGQNGVRQAQLFSEAVPVAEVVNLSFYLFPLAIGAAAAAVVGIAGGGAAVELITFAVLTGVSFTVVRPIARRHINMPPQLRTGTAALIGRTAIVTER